MFSAVSTPILLWLRRYHGSLKRQREILLEVARSRVQVLLSRGARSRP